MHLRFSGAFYANGIFKTAESRRVVFIVWCWSKVLLLVVILALFPFHAFQKWIDLLMSGSNFCSFRRHLSMTAQLLPPDSFVSVLYVTTCNSLLCFTGFWHDRRVCHFSPRLVTFFVSCLNWLDQETLNVPMDSDSYVKRRGHCQSDSRQWFFISHPHVLAVVRFREVAQQN